MAKFAKTRNGVLNVMRLAEKHWAAKERATKKGKEKQERDGAKPHKKSQGRGPRSRPPQLRTRHCHASKRMTTPRGGEKQGPWPKRWYLSKSRGSNIRDPLGNRTWQTPKKGGINSP